eukprot:scaffold1141_cov128-Isochrysis_galbana.AAC.19
MQPAGARQKIRLRPVAATARTARHALWDAINKQPAQESKSGTAGGQRRHRVHEETLADLLEQPEVGVGGCERAKEKAVQQQVEQAMLHHPLARQQGDGPVLLVARQQPGHCRVQPSTAHHEQEEGRVDQAPRQSLQVERARRVGRGAEHIRVRDGQPPENSRQQHGHVVQRPRSVG